MERVVPVVTGLVQRFDTPVSVDTWRASVARASYAEGAVMGNDISGLGDPDYAPAAAEHGAAVVITHIRLKPRVADPEPHYDDLVPDVARFLSERAQGALAAGVPAERIVLDAGLDLGKTAEQSLDPAARLAHAGRPRFPAAPLRFQQDVPRQDPRPRADRAPRGLARRGGPRHRLGLSHPPGARRAGHPARARRARGDRRGVVSKGAAASTYLVRGDDPALVAQEVRDLLADVVGERDHALVVEEVGGGPGDDIDVGAIVDACLTPALSDRPTGHRRARRRPPADRDAPRLVEVVQNPLPTTVLVLVGGGGTVPAPLIKAVQAAGQVLDVTTGKPKDRQSWLHEHVRGAPVTLDRDALALLTEHVGEDLGRVEGLLSALTAAYGEGATISEADLVPYLGERGNVPRYQLTDAIDRGEPGQALRVLHRMLDTGSLVPIQVLATLHGHFSNMLVLDGDDVLGERDAAAILGSAPFVAKKALEQSRRLGSTRIGEAINLIAKADLDVRGASGLDSVMVVEILVARLARQTRPTRQTRPRAGARR